MGIDQPECGAGSWQGQHRKMAEYENWQNIKPNIRSRRAVGCNLVVLKRAAPPDVAPQSHCKIQASFSATPCEQFKVLSALV
jgi:hypothetical protein